MYPTPKADWRLLARRAKLLVAATLLLLAPLKTARAQAAAQFSPRCYFSTEAGASPTATLFEDADGVFYGTTAIGGDNGTGTFFKYDPIQNVNSTIYNLPAIDKDSVNAIGAFPHSSVIKASDGRFYFTTSEGGAHSFGSVLAVFIDDTGTHVTNCHSFALAGDDGGVPNAGLISANGNLFGVASLGGLEDNGTLFEVSIPSQTVTTILGIGDEYGRMPEASLVLGPSNDAVFGVTSQGAKGGGGGVFVTTVETTNVLTLFDAPAADGTNSTGASPNSPVALAPDGTVYGTAAQGGIGGTGVIYRVQNGSQAPEVIHSFTALDESGSNADGARPVGITLGPDGNFYGACVNGGANGNGTIFQITPGGVLTVLHDFGPTDQDANNEDGVRPEGGLLLGSDKLFWGTASAGGGFGRGVVFSFDMSPTITSATSVTAGDGVPFSYQVVATNSPTSYDAAGLPPGLTIDPTTGIISGTPARGGSTDVPLSARNGFGSATATLTIAVADPPVITSADAAEGQQGAPFQYAITATNGPASYGADGLPDGLTVDPASGIIAGTPTAAGTFAVTIKAVNDAGTGTEPLTLTVAPIPPVVSVAPTVPVATLGDGSPGVFTLTLSAPQSTAVVVQYTLRGSAQNGVDYVLLSGHKKIKPGKTSKAVQVIPQGDLGGASKKTVKLGLEPADGVYTVGTPGKVKVKIVQAN